MAQEYYNLARAAEVLNVGSAEVNKLREQGALHGYRDGSDWKFKKEDVDALLAERIRNRSKAQEDLLLSDDDFETDADTAATMLGGMGSLLDRAGVETPQTELDLKLPVSEIGTADDLVLVDDGGDATILQGALTSPVPRPSAPEDVLSIADDSSSEIFGLEEGSQEEGRVDPAGLDDDDVVLGGSGSGSGSDLNLGGDSGISLLNPSDSGLSLDDPIEILGNVDEVLELGEDDMLALVGDDVGINTDTATQLKPDDDFLLTASSDDDDESSESSSQVIALDSDADFGDLLGGAPAAPALGGAMEMTELGLEPVDGPALVLDPGGPDTGLVAATPVGFQAPTQTAATPTMGSAAVPLPAEAPYSGLLIAGLGCCIMSLALCGIVTVDLIRNMWSWNQPFTLNSTLMDLVLGLFGG